MNKTFTKIFCIACVLTLFTALKSSAQLANPSPADTVSETEYNPAGRLWGYSFGDFYYDAHSPSLTAPVPSTQGKETNYFGVPTYRNAFQIRRIYLGYDYDINRRFSVELLLASEPDASDTPIKNTTITNNDNLADNKMGLYIRLINLRWKKVWPGTDLVAGEISTPGYSLIEEKIWGYRMIEKTIADVHGTNSHDIGAALQGSFDPGFKNFGYNVMVGDNTGDKLLSAATPNTGFFKEFYGDLYAKFFNKQLVFTVYADYVKTSSTILATANTPRIGTQSHNMVKGFVAYTTPKFTLGVEAFNNFIQNGVTAVGSTEVQTPGNVTSKGISVFTRGVIYKDRVGFYARYDNYNPDNDYNNANTYLVNTTFSHFDPATREQFATAGIDLTPRYGIHFIPNVWFDYFKDLRNPASATVYQGDNHILIYRLTFSYLFGK